MRDDAIKAAQKVLQGETSKAQKVADGIHDGAVDGLLAAQKTYTETVGKIMAAAMNVTSSDPSNPSAPRLVDQAALDAAFLTLENARKTYDVANGGAEVGYVEAVGKANIKYAESARDAAVQLADTVAHAALTFATTQDALTKTMVDSASGLKQAYDDDMAGIDAAYGEDVASQSHTLADKIAGYDKTLATTKSDASKLESDTISNAQQVDDHALADKNASDDIARATVAADTAMNAAGLQWLADEIKLAKEEFKAFQLADLGYATSAIAAGKKQAYADSDAAHTANLNSAIAVQKAEYAAITAQCTDEN